MIRPVQPQDVKYITDIYNEYILNIRNRADI
jgi:L-amino acid N-acyltransferase YncA